MIEIMVMLADILWPGHQTPDMILLYTDLFSPIKQNLRLRTVHFIVASIYLSRLLASPRPSLHKPLVEPHMGWICALLLAVTYLGDSSTLQREFELIAYTWYPDKDPRNVSKYLSEGYLELCKHINWELSVSNDLVQAFRVEDWGAVLDMQTVDDQAWYMYETFGKPRGLIGN